jgi:hypothetical protein
MTGAIVVEAPPEAARRKMSIGRKDRPGGTLKTWVKS